MLREAQLRKAYFQQWMKHHHSWCSIRPWCWKRQQLRPQKSRCRTSGCKGHPITFECSEVSGLGMKQSGTSSRCWDTKFPAKKAQGRCHQKLCLRLPFLILEPNLFKHLDGWIKKYVLLLFSKLCHNYVPIILRKVFVKRLPIQINLTYTDTNKFWSLLTIDDSTPQIQEEMRYMVGLESKVREQRKTL